jgi:hypothetical protein
MVTALKEVHAGEDVYDVDPRPLMTWSGMCHNHRMVGALEQPGDLIDPAAIPREA